MLPFASAATCFLSLLHYHLLDPLPYDYAMPDNNLITSKVKRQGPLPMALSHDFTLMRAVTCIQEVKENNELLRLIPVLDLVTFLI